jgi:hypothetical protein
MPVNHTMQSLEVDPEIQSIIDAAQPGMLDLIDAYESCESYYMAAAQVPQASIVAGANSALPY